MPSTMGIDDKQSASRKRVFSVLSPSFPGVLINRYIARTLVAYPAVRQTIYNGTLTTLIGAFYTSLAIRSAVTGITHKADKILDLHGEEARMTVAQKENLPEDDEALLSTSEDEDMDPGVVFADPTQENVRDLWADKEVEGLDQSAIDAVQTANLPLFSLNKLKNSLTGRSQESWQDQEDMVDKAVITEVGEHALQGGMDTVLAGAEQDPLTRPAVKTMRISCIRMALVGTSAGFVLGNVLMVLKAPLQFAKGTRLQNLKTAAPLVGMRFAMLLGSATQIDCWRLKSRFEVYAGNI
eukprot:Clim_evm7s171 gene=Clim_evmTU7s171